FNPRSPCEERLFHYNLLVIKVQNFTKCELQLFKEHLYFLPKTRIHIYLHVKDIVYVAKL
ncbi:MAG: hypothetical protein WCR55_04705, partial [Lentisphaerota bacterium]